MENKVFETLNSINVNDMVEKKQTGGTTLTYLSWSSAWQIVKKKFSGVSYEIERNPETNLPYWYDPLTGYMVFTKITINGQTHEMWLPILDSGNRAMKAQPYEVKTKYKTVAVAAASMADINRSIMRCLVKNLAMFGLGLYIYQGEDLPDSQSCSAPTQAQPTQPAKPVEKATQAQVPAQAPVKDNRLVTVNEIKKIREVLNNNGMDEQFICRAYRVKKLGDLQMYQFTHIEHNISKLKTMHDNEKQQHLADMVKNAKKADAEMSVSFGDAIATPQQEKDDSDGESIDLKSLGLTEADLDALTDLGSVFS